MASKTKAEAARENGRRGGRPRKHPRANPPETPTKPAGKWALTRREEQFVHQLVTFPEKTQGQCYLDAGYRASTADGAIKNASKLARKDHVARAIAAAKQAESERHQVTRDRVVQELGRIGFADKRKLFERREAAPVKPEDLYNACRNHEWTLPFDKLSVAEQTAWTAAAVFAGQRASGGYFLRSPHELDDDTAAALAGIEVVTKSLGHGEVEYIYKIKTEPKTPALALLAKHLGMLKDEKEKSHAVPLFALPADVRPDLSGAGT